MPRGKKSAPDQATLQMALKGYEIERERIAGKIRDIQSHLGGHESSGRVAAKGEAAPKRVLSAAARKRIAAAQRKRWAEHRKNQAAAKG
jgi:hypothetical protein